MSGQTPAAPHWADIGESTSVAGVVFLCWVHRWFGRWPFRLCVWPVVLCHWLTNGVARRASLQYLQRLQQHTGALGHAPRRRDSLRFGRAGYLASGGVHALVRA